MTDYEERRGRVLVQVIARWTGIDFNADADVNLTAEVAADAVYCPEINDLDWEAATLRRLGYTGVMP